MKILITGAAGFIGSHLAEELVFKGHHVIGIDNFSDYYSVELKRKNQKDVEAGGVEIIEGDLRNISDLKSLPHDFDIIYHLAAQPGISSSLSFEDYFSNNVMATQNLLEYSLNNKALKFFINISTSSVYGLYATKSEADIPEPVSWYGVSKLAAEQLVLAQSRLNKLSACSLRLYSVYGPRERPDKLFTKLISCAINQEAFPLYHGSEKHLRSFTYIDDIVKAMLSVLDHIDKVNNCVINIGNEEERSTQEGIDIVEEIIQKPVPIKHIPPRAGDQLRTCANISLAKELLNYHPSTSLREGLKKQTAWLQL